MTPSFSALYEANLYDVTEVTDIHPRITAEVSISWQRAFVMKSYLFVFEGHTHTEVVLLPQYVMVGTPALYKFYAYLLLVGTYPGAEITPGGISFPRATMDQYGWEIIAHTYSCMLEFPPDNYWGTYFRTLNDYVSLTFSTLVMSHYSPVYPYFTDSTRGTVGLRSPLGQVLVEDREEVTPTFVLGASFLTYPQAPEVLLADELTQLQQRKDVFVDNSGLHILMKKDKTGILRSSSVVAQAHRIDRSIRYAEITRPTATMDVKAPQEMFINYKSSTLDPRTYNHERGSYVDYSHASTMRKGIFR